MKKKFIVILILILFFIPIKLTQATNSLDDVNITLSLNDDGSAHVKQIWQAYSDENSEFYIVFDKSHNGEISNFTVRDETGSLYTNVDTWKEEASLEEKANKSAIRAYQRELVFGITNYGNKTYELNYDLKNLVQSFQDYDGFYLQFFNNFKVPPKNLKLTVEKQGTSFTKENSKFYIKDVSNEISYNDGKIEVKATKSLTDSSKVKVVMGFDKNIVRTETSTDIKFDYFKKSMLDSSTNNVVEFIGVAIFLVAMALAYVLYVGRISLKTRIPHNNSKIKLNKDFVVNENEIKDVFYNISPEEVLYLTNIVNNKNKKILEPSKIENILITYFIDYTNKNIFEIVDDETLGEDDISKKQILVNSYDPNIFKGERAKEKLLEIITANCLDENSYFNKQLLEKYLKENIKETRILCSLIREQGLKKCINKGFVKKSKFSLKITNSGIKQIQILNYIASNIKEESLSDSYFENDKDNIDVAISLGVVKQFINLRQKYNKQLKDNINASFDSVKIQYYVENILYLAPFGAGFIETFPVSAGIGAVGGGVGVGGGAR